MKYLIGLAIVAILLLTSQMDYEDEALLQADYCDMVAQGAWPDYNQNYEEVCE